MAGIELDNQHSYQFDDFLSVSKQFSKGTPIYPDSDLGDGQRGEDVGVAIKERGFREIYLVTGFPASITKNAVIKHAFLRLRLPQLFAGHNPTNDRSRILLEKLGFKSIGDVFYEPTGQDHPSYVYRPSNFPTGPSGWI